MKNKKWLWIGLAATLVVLVIVVGVMQSGGGKVTPVQLAKVEAQDITSRVRAPGKIEPRTQVKVSADVAGKITKLAVNEGQAVRKGDLMVQLDDVQYRAAYIQAQATMKSAQARLGEAQASLKVTESNYKRQRRLYDDNLLSDAEWDQATTTYEAARVAALTAEEEVSRGRAMSNAALDNLNKCRLIAPFDGVVSALYVEEGEIVVIGTMNNPGTQILTVSDLSRMLVQADVDETDVVNVRLGQEATITVDAFPDTTFTGTVHEIGNTARRASTSSLDGQTNFEVEVVFDESVPEIRPGMTADVEISTATSEKTLGVPIQSVVVRTPRELEREGKKKRRDRKSGDAVAAEAGDGSEDADEEEQTDQSGIFVSRDGVAEWIPVRTGIASETTIEVFGELQDGDEVVSGPYRALRELKPGAKLKKTEARDRRRS